MDFDCKWVDGDWHHLAVTWDGYAGVVKLYFDGEEVDPFWKASGGEYGVWPSKTSNSMTKEEFATVAKGQVRRGTGAVALGQDQECLGGCFKQQVSLHGYLADIRVWDIDLSPARIVKNMYTPGVTAVESEEEQKHLVASYLLLVPPEGEDNGLESIYDSNTVVKDGSLYKNHLYLGGNTPIWDLSNAPLLERTSEDEIDHVDPQAGAAGSSLMLNDAQAVILEDFEEFPGRQLTVEFWMWSVDSCRKGVPFSYATGSYNEADNSFLIFNYNDWGVAVMEDEGTASDHTSGISSTDGRWHHISVTWESETGKVILYDNGRPVWSVKRAQGAIIPSGGTLVVGREQDCLGGCYDSAPGAAGSVDPVKDIQYGIQDFYGAIEEMRIWDVVRTQDEILYSMRMDDGLAPYGYKHGTFNNPGINPESQGLVAYWKFDEGKGYHIVDSTGKGHDLRMTNDPVWRVVEWLAVCGNGILEGNEECDDGNREKGDGCDNECKVETGYKCNKASPSECVDERLLPPIDPSPSPTPSPSPIPSPSPSPLPSPSSASSVSRITVKGNQCVFPTVYRGESLMDCMDISGKSRCKTAAGVWEDCAPTTMDHRTVTPSKAPRVTVTGHQCFFPLDESGNSYCMIDTGGNEYCRNYDGLWEDCEPIASNVVPKKENNDDTSPTVVVDDSSQSSALQPASSSNANVQVPTQVIGTKNSSAHVTLIVGMSFLLILCIGAAGYVFLKTRKVGLYNTLNFIDICGFCRMTL